MKGKPTPVTQVGQASVRLEGLEKTNFDMVEAEFKNLVPGQTGEPKRSSVMAFALHLAAQSIWPRISTSAISRSGLVPTPFVVGK